MLFALHEPFFLQLVSIVADQIGYFEKHGPRFFRVSSSSGSCGSGSRSKVEFHFFFLNLCLIFANFVVCCLHFESQDTGITGPELTLDLVLERLQFVVGSLELGLLQLEQVVDIQNILRQHLLPKNVEEGREMLSEW